MQKADVANFFFIVNFSIFSASCTFLGSEFLICDFVCCLCATRHNRLLYSVFRNESCFFLPLTFFFIKSDTGARRTRKILFHFCVANTCVVKSEKDILNSKFYSLHGQFLSNIASFVVSSRKWQQKQIKRK